MSLFIIVFILVIALAIGIFNFFQSPEYRQVINPNCIMLNNSEDGAHIIQNAVNNRDLSISSFLMEKWVADAGFDPISVDIAKNVVNNSRSNYIKNGLAALVRSGDAKLLDPFTRLEVIEKVKDSENQDLVKVKVISGKFANNIGYVFESDTDIVTINDLDSSNKSQLGKNNSKSYKIASETPQPNAPQLSPAEAAAVPIYYSVTGITARDTLNVRTGPGSNYNVTDKLPNGYNMIRILDEPVMNGDTEWVHITFENRTGWVNKMFLKPSKSDS